MEGPPRPAPGWPIVAESPRVRLARLALGAARAVDGVADTDAGPSGLFFTAAGEQRLLGVTCVAAGDEAYDVALRLVCELVPLPQLGDRVRAAVTSVAVQAGIPLAGLTITITGVVAPGER